VNERSQRAARRGLRALRRHVAFVHFTLPAGEFGCAPLDGEPVEAWASGVDYPVKPGTQNLTYSVDGTVRFVAHAVVRRGEHAELTLSSP